MFTSRCIVDNALRQKINLATIWNLIPTWLQKGGQHHCKPPPQSSASSAPRLERYLGPGLPGFPWYKGISLAKPPFGVRGRYNLTRCIYTNIDIGFSVRFPGPVETRYCIKWLVSFVKMHWALIVKNHIMSCYSITFARLHCIYICFHHLARPKKRKQNKQKQSEIWFQVFGLWTACKNMCFSKNINKCTLLKCWNTLRHRGLSSKWRPAQAPLTPSNKRIRKNI